MRRRVALMVAVALVAAACGGGSDEGGSATSGPSGGETTEDEATEAPAGSDEVVSADGRLTAAPPPGSPTITVEEIDVSELEPPDGFEFFGSYELGPDGMEFDDPVTLTFQLPDEVLTGGVVVIHDSGGETSEPLELRLVGDGLLEAEVTHFSRVTVIWEDGAERAFDLDLALPSLLAVGDFGSASWELTALAAERRGVVLHYTTPSTVIDAGAPLVVRNPPPPGTGLPFVTIECSAVGDGSLAWSGLLRLEYDMDWRPVDVLSRAPRVVEAVEFEQVDVDRQVSCVEKTANPLDFADERCVDWNTSEEREDCPVPQLEISFDDLAADVRLTPPPEAFANPDDSLAASFWAFDGEVTVAVECRWPDGWCNFFNQFFLPATNEPGFSISMNEAGEVDITSLPFTVRDGMVWITWPDLEFHGGDGEVLDQLPAGSAPIVDANTFTRTGDLFHTGNMDLDAVAVLVGEG